MDLLSSDIWCVLYPFNANPMCSVLRSAIMTANSGTRGYFERVDFNCGTALPGLTLTDCYIISCEWELN